MISYQNTFLSFFDLICYRYVSLRISHQLFSFSNKCFDSSNCILEHIVIPKNIIQVILYYFFNKSEASYITLYYHWDCIQKYMLLLRHLFFVIASYLLLQYGSLMKTLCQAVAYFIFWQVKWTMHETYVKSSRLHAW